MSRAQLIAMARKDLEHGRQGTQDQAEGIYKVPVSKYYDPDHFAQEMSQIFHRLPLLMATTAELREVGDYKAMEAVGRQVLITRTKEGVKAFLNMCSHRGARLVHEGCGSAHRFTCPYHAWTFSPSGDLVAVYSADDFGDLDKSEYGLTALPCLEKAGLIWVTLAPDSTLDIEQFLSGYDSLLAEFGFADWHFEKSQRVEGPNWKVAYDGYLDYYHLPILHRETFGTEIGNKANYYSWGPHTHMGRPDASFEEFENLPDEEWPDERVLAGVWTIFPHISIASFFGGGRSVMISQLFPGETPETSHTNQIFLMQREPETEELKREAAKQFQFLEYVVQEEDYATGIALQKNLSIGARDHVLFGKNERGGQYFHQWVDRILETSDEDLPKLFQTG
ncbi:MAG: aromatic ring-hydroxylating dioxygenase subunit alpha [Pseudomonadales bacterium]|nr:aromatic ring-hydroxylating dioxygenase subunit alpha [Pseudomonadales bacterium]MBO6700876.1 aromatic ring-hydroxylating dioxygenase subunit alpha [Pseudomonadales bacterium]MBO7007825.1 aromatic ring-hydroxylating dioxygenase subunit alpha [Pseudomonadales bacterium]